MHPMKKFFSFLAVWLVVAGVRAALPQPDLIAQIHFAGAQKFSAAPRAAAFTNEFCSAEAVALRQQTADKLSVWLAGWLAANAGAAVPDGAAKLRPLLDDLQVSEWFAEARAAAGGGPQAAIAIKLDADRTQLWLANLKPFFLAGSFKSADGWLFVTTAAGANSLVDELVKKMFPVDKSLLDLDVNWPRLAQWFPKLKELALPETQFTLTAPDDNFRLNGKFFFPEELVQKLEPWRVPTNTIHQPFVSFTAVRGFSQWLDSQPWAQPFMLSPTPNQMFVWSMPKVSYRTFAAVPFADATNALELACARLQPVIESHKAPGNFFGAFNLEHTKGQALLSGMPMIIPYLNAIGTPAGQFLLAGGFPNTPRSKPLPPGMFQPLAQSSLVFYHWEITSERFSPALDLTEISFLLTDHRQFDTESTAMKWMKTFVPRLGNNVTEINRTGPAEMTFKRVSNGIFTATELIALGCWLEAPNFPGCNLNLPLRPAHKVHPPLNAPPSAPAPAK